MNPDLNPNLTIDFLTHVHEVWTNQKDTKRAFLELTEDEDIRSFIIRELGKREDYFTDQQEFALYLYLERAINNFIISGNSFNLEKVDFNILTLRLLLSLKDHIQLYKDLKRPIKTTMDLYLLEDEDD